MRWLQMALNDRPARAPADRSRWEARERGGVRLRGGDVDPPRANFLVDPRSSPAEHAPDGDAP